MDSGHFTFPNQPAGLEIDALVERLKQARRGSDDLTADIYEVVGYQVKRQRAVGLGQEVSNRSVAWRYLDGRSWLAMADLTNSLDAITNLARKILPGWDLSSSSMGDEGSFSEICMRGRRGDTTIFAGGCTEPVARCIAFLIAYSIPVGLVGLVGSVEPDVALPMPDYMPKELPANWSDVLDSRAKAAYLNDTGGTRDILIATGHYLRAIPVSDDLAKTAYINGYANGVTGFIGDAESDIAEAAAQSWEINKSEALSPPSAQNGVQA